MFPICQRYALKAIHNFIARNLCVFLMFPICQRYALKAIHNRVLGEVEGHADVSNMSKIRFESNSQ